MKKSEFYKRFTGAMADAIIEARQGQTETVDEAVEAEAQAETEE